MISSMIIKELREQRGFTQAELCDGICSQEQLSRIERDKHIPNFFTFSLLLQRLGENPELYYNTLVTKNYKYLNSLLHKINLLMVNGQLDEAKIRLDEFVEQEGASSSPWKKWQLICRAVVTDDAEEALGMVLSAIKTDRPDFEVDKIGTYLFSLHEISELNTLATRTFYARGLDEAIRVYRMIKKNIDRGFYNEYFYCEHHLHILSNLTYLLGEAGHHQESIDLAINGKFLCFKHARHEYLHKFQSDIAKGLFRLGETEDGTAALKKLIHLYRSYGTELGGGDEESNTMALFEKEFGVRLAGDIEIRIC